MFGHYLAFTLRKIIRSPGTAALSIFGLALGIACFLMAFGTANYLSMSDRHFEKSSRVYVLTAKLESENLDAIHIDYSPGAVGLYLQEDFPNLEAVSRVLSGSERTAFFDGRKVSLQGAMADADFFEIFDFEFIEGNPETALDNRNKVVLTEATARKLFGGASALGKSIRLSDDYMPTVGGVIRFENAPSHLGHSENKSLLLYFDFLQGWDSDSRISDNWSSLAVRTYLLFPEDESITPTQFEQQIDQFVNRRAPPGELEGRSLSMRLMPVEGYVANAFSLYMFGEAAETLSITVLFTFLGMLVLGVACVNYANLATAQAAGRGKEVGMRKVLGASPFQTLIQYWADALLHGGLATIVALVAVSAVSPVIVNMSPSLPVDVRLGLFSSATPLLILSIVIVAATFVASLYPFFVLARVEPVEALRAGTVRAGPKIITQSLVTVQFAIVGIFLIILTIMLQQNEYLRTNLLQKQHAIVILSDGASNEIGYEALAADLDDDPEIKAVTQISPSPFSNSFGLGEFSRQPDGRGQIATAALNVTGYDFFSVVDVQVLAGRVFDRNRNDATPSEEVNIEQSDANLSENIGQGDRLSRIIIDDALREELGFVSPDDAIGQVFYPSNAAQGQGDLSNYEIIGVVQSMPLQLFSFGVTKNVYLLRQESFKSALGPIMISFSRDNTAAALEAIRKAIEARDPFALPKMVFFEDAFSRSFSGFEFIQNFLAGLALLAFSIAVMGLFAMATFVAARRRHEIGVRKTLGASTGSIVRLLLRDFTTPVIIGNLIGWPLAYLAVQVYLGLFTQQVGITPFPWIIGLAVTVVIAWFAVGGQAWRAARANPAEVLRNE